MAVCIRMDGVEITLGDASVAGRLCAWLENLTVTQGPLAGQPLTLLPWEREFVHGAFGPGIDRAGLTVSRGNGKTTLAAAVAWATVCPDSPIFQPRGETVIVAGSYEQAGILFEHIESFGAAELSNRKVYRWLNGTAKRLITHRASGATIKLISSDAKRAHGLAPALVLADEPAQWESGGDAMLAALMTSRGKVSGSRFIALGTRPRNKLHWFSRMLKKGSGPTRYMQSHAAGCLDDPSDESQWHLANPSLEHMPELEAIIRSEAQDAADDPGLLALFQALRLNGGVSEVANRDMLIQPGLWTDLLCQPEASRDGRMAWGIDLGGAAAMSAIAACWETGRLETLAMFGADPDLDARAKRDAVGELYRLGSNAGELVVSGRRVPDIQELLCLAEDRFGRRPDLIVCDRWRLPELRDSLEDQSWQNIPLVTRGQGFKDGSEDVRAWRRACVERRVNPAQPAIILTAALAEAVTVADAAGNEKLAKNSEGGRRQAARDDCAAAAILAVAHGLSPFAQDSEESSAVLGGFI